VTAVTLTAVTAVTAKPLGQQKVVTPEAEILVTAATAATPTEAHSYH
jgi:hypothetical protein